MKTRWLVPMAALATIAALALTSSAALADSGFAFVDWTSGDATQATGTMHGSPVQIVGPVGPAVTGSVFDGTFPQFSSAAFTPSLPSTDDVYLVSTDAGNAYTLNFAAPVHDPVIDFASLGSTISFPAGTGVTKVSGDAGLTVSGSSVTGAPALPPPGGVTDSNGTVRLSGVFRTLTLVAGYTSGAPDVPDGIYMQLGGTVEGPQTEITLDPAQPGSGGFYTGPVGIRLGAVDGSGGGAVQTRCVLDPPTPPASFDQFPAQCPFAYFSHGSVTTSGTHTIYGASRDGFGLEDAVVSTTFRVSIAPDTTITDGPTGTIWDVSPKVTFTSTVPGSTFECKLDGAAFAACATPFRISGLVSGDHTFAVRAIAPGGGVDASPAVRTFTLGARASRQLSCEVRPVYWLSAMLGVDRHPDKYACEIRSPSWAGVQCQPENICNYENQDCPTSAMCTLSTRLSWYDADTKFDWGAIVQVGQDPRMSPWWGLGLTLNDYRPHVSDIEHCTTGFDGDRCFATASITAIGDGTPLWAGCSVELIPGGGIIGVSKFTYDDVRRLECDADLTIKPASPFALTVLGLSVLVRAPSPGSLVASFNAQLATRKARIASTPGPKIATARVKVTRAGAVAIPLKLNAAAKRYLRAHKTLVASVRTTFTGDGAAPLTTTSRITVHGPTKPARVCRAKRASKGARRTVTCETGR